jgi:serine/threonine-protein kinase RsbW
MSGNNFHNPRRRWRRTLSVPAQPQSAPRVRSFVREAADAAGFPPRAVDEIELAVGEAVTNAILYGPRPHGSPSARFHEAEIVVDIGVDSRVLFIEVCDPGPGFDPEGARRSGHGNLEEPGGRGLDLMDALMDHVHFHFDGTGTRVRMERFLFHTP